MNGEEEKNKTLNEDITISLVLLLNVSLVVNKSEAYNGGSPVMGPETLAWVVVPHRSKTPNGVAAFYERQSQVTFNHASLSHFFFFFFFSKFLSQV